MTELIYLKNSYQKELSTNIVAITPKGDHYEIELEKTIAYPQGGGQPCDKGEIIGSKGKLIFTHVRLTHDRVLHEGKVTGTLHPRENVKVAIDWNTRVNNMRIHSAGHVIHEVIMETIPGLTPVKGEHSKQKFIEYEGTINPKLLETLEKRSNMLIASNQEIKTEIVTLSELQKRSRWVPLHLPKNKPLRIMQIGGYPPIPDGGTQVATTSEIGIIAITQIEQIGPNVRVHYSVQEISEFAKSNAESVPSISLEEFKLRLTQLQMEIFALLKLTTADELETLHVKFFGSNGKASKIIKLIRGLSISQRRLGGLAVNSFKQNVEDKFRESRSQKQEKAGARFDISLPGTPPPQGHLHIVSQAIFEITRIFERIGFTRVRHPEVDWDWYAFESLNMPPNHPARDEWETFFVEREKSKVFIGISGSHTFDASDKYGKIQNTKFSKMVLTPHTSNGQVREMEKGKLPIRMINIAKCYRRQSDVSHVPMFHQFEGMYIDKNVSIGHLKGVMDYFFKQYYGPERKSRLRPFHFQFTEPSFEVDINCGVCLGKVRLPGGKTCKLCKDGWLELGGSGMVHPAVLQNGGIDPDVYSGFAFGWGIERVAMMKSGTQLDDIRLLYSNDLRFLEQF